MAVVSSTDKISPCHILIEAGQNVSEIVCSVVISARKKIRQERRTDNGKAWQGGLCNFKRMIWKRFSDTLTFE